MALLQADTVGWQNYCNWAKSELEMENQMETELENKRETARNEPTKLGRFRSDFLHYLLNYYWGLALMQGWCLQKYARRRSLS